MEAHAEAHGHSPHLAHHFDTEQQQFDAGKLGMWLFLATEVLLFGGLFCAYAVYRGNHPEVFIYAHRFLDPFLGGVNTIVLICSSLTMAWGVRCAQLGQRRGLIVCLVLTLLGGFGFMGIKAVEYEHKWKHGLLWGALYDPGKDGHGEHDADHAAPADAHQSAGAPAAATVETVAATPVASEGGLAIEPSRVALAPEGPPGLALHIEDDAGHKLAPEAPRNVQTFFAVYFAMTGLHGLHVLAGMLAIGWVLVRAVKRHFGPQYYTPVDFVGLYWHLVDLIWIYLFPLLYLIH